MALEIFNAVMAGELPKKFAFLPGYKADCDIMAMAMRRAHLFEVSPKASGLHTYLSNLSPVQMVEYIHDAVLPADNVWVEFPTDDYDTDESKGGRRTGLLLSGRANDPNCEILIRSITRYGENLATDLQIDHMQFRLRTERGSNVPKAIMHRLCDNYNVPHQFAEVVWGLGAVYSNNQRDLTQRPGLHWLFANTAHDISPWPFRVPGPDFLLEEVTYSTLWWTRGLGALIMLNHLSLMKHTAGQKQGRYKTRSGPTKPYALVYGYVDIKMTAARTIRAIRREVHSRAPKMEHMVRDHWAYRRKTTDPNCFHDWQRNGIRSQERCHRCNGLRWHRDGFRRGDPSLGSKITSHYVIR